MQKASAMTPERDEKLERCVVEIDSTESSALRAEAGKKLRARTRIFQQMSFSFKMM